MLQAEGQHPNKFLVVHGKGESIVTEDNSEATTVEETTSSKEERTWAMACHLSSASGFVIPLGNIFAPLVIWLIKKDEFPLVADQGKESLNFQITVLIAAILSAMLTLVLIGFLLLPAVAIYWIIFTIIAAMRANEGESYRYPCTLRFIK